MPRPRKVEIYVATVEFWCAQEDNIVRVGERVRAGHPLVRDYPQNFEPVDTTVHYDVEQATAAPGEMRG